MADVVNLQTAKRWFLEPWDLKCVVLQTGLTTCGLKFTQTHNRDGFTVMEANVMKMSCMSVGGERS